MPVRPNREYRNAPIFEVREAQEGEDKSFVVEGYASTFDRFELFEMEGVKYYEQVDPHAFDEADFSDCCFLKDHTGTVLARTKNGTVEINIDERGLFTKTDLSKTDAAKQMHQEIEAGMYDQMSFAFTVAEDAYDRDTHTRTILKVKKVYDVSAVSVPANPNTDIGVATRAAFDGFIEAEKADLLEREQRLKSLQLEKDKLLLRLRIQR